MAGLLAKARLKEPGVSQVLDARILATIIVADDLLHLLDAAPHVFVVGTRLTRAQAPLFVVRDRASRSIDL